VVYVWFDALINYASAVGFGGSGPLFDQWWPADLHIIGKDITRFHTVIWPAMLMAAGVALPRQVFGHGFITVNGQRMSKSLGTVIDPIEAAGRHGADPLRLYLTKEIPFGGDGDFSWERYDERYNVDLANNLGNLVSRISAMVSRYRQGRMRPTGAPSDRLAGVAAGAAAAYRRAMDAYALHDGAAAAFRIIDATNEYIAETAPWALAKDPSNADRLTQVLFDAAEAVRVAAVLLTPIMPTASAEILERIGAGHDDVRLDADGAWRNQGERQLTDKGPLWPRIQTDTKAGARSAAARDTSMSDNETTTARGAEKTAAAATPAAAGTQTGQAGGTADPRSAGAPQPAAAGVATIAIDDFMKIELRVAKVLAAERVPKSSKLLKLRVDAGSEERTIVAGIAEAYEPDALVGRSIAIVANLRPVKLMGIESNGMVLAASQEGGTPLLVSFEQAPPPGTRIR
jgi:methionyl-tRNA synthetase